MPYKTYGGKAVGKTMIFAEGEDGEPEPIKASDLGGGGGSMKWDDIKDKPEKYPPESHDHDDLYYTKSEVDDMINDLQSQIDNLKENDDE